MFFPSFDLLGYHPLLHIKGSWRTQRYEQTQAQRTATTRINQPVLGPRPPAERSAHNGCDFRGALQHLRRELECFYVEVCVATVIGVGEV